LVNTGFTRRNVYEPAAQGPHLIGIGACRIGYNITEGSRELKIRPSARQIAVLFKVLADQLPILCGKEVNQQRIKVSAVSFNFAHRYPPRNRPEIQQVHRQQSACAYLEAIDADTMKHQARPNYW